MEAVSGEGANGFARGFGFGIPSGGLKTGGKLGGGVIGAFVGGVLGILTGGIGEYNRQERLPESFRFPSEAPLGEEPIPRLWKTIDDNEKKRLLLDFNNLPGPFNNDPCP